MFSSRPGPLPFPPPELRQLVGPLEDHFYDNSSGALVFPEAAPEAYDFVFDWGCGCGRLARQLIQQQPRPRRYMGIDLHRGMIDWCRRNLAPHAPGFEFHHHDVVNIGLNPGGRATHLPFPAPDAAVTLFLAWSVFTHVNEAVATFYLRELGRILHRDGFAITTWFLFDKADYPMMQEFQNALFINDIDPTNAVIFDKAWLRRTADQAGLVLARIVPPDIRGYQWRVYMKKAGAAPPAEFPPDVAARGIERPPLMPEKADHLGLGEDREREG
jgi:SAM-dependent methyltransferase